MIRQIVIAFILLSGAAFSAHSQEAPYKFDFGGGLGVSGYLGDANTSSMFKHPGFTMNVGSRYLPNVRWAFRGLLGYTTLSGNTAEMENYLPGGVQYSFTSSVFSLDLRAEFNFLPYGIGETYKKLSRWTPYLLFGTGFCISAAEGQSAGAAILPMGAGIKYKLKQRLNLSAEFSMTKVFGDKVDGPYLNDLAGIKTSFFKNTDWFSRFTLSITFEFGERCQTCHYVD